MNKLFQVPQQNKIIITPRDHNNFIVDFSLDEMRTAVNRQFEFTVKNAHFIPKVQKKYWDGKTKFLSAVGTFPVGLLGEFIEVVRKPIYSLKFGKAKILFKGISSKDFIQKYYQPKLNFPWIKNPELLSHLIRQPDFQIRDYQEIGTLTALKNGRAILKFPTGSGKTCLIYLISMSYNFIFPKSRHLIIVPNISLLEQTTNNINEFAQKDIINQIHNKNTELKPGLNILTWQTLLSYIKRKKISPKAGSIIIDECHSLAKGYEIKKTVEFFKNTRYRFGLTATLPSDPLEKKNIIAACGPVRASYVADSFIRKGILSKGKIHVIQIHHRSSLFIQREREELLYAEVKNRVFESPFRLEILISLIKKCYEKNEKVLVITEKNEKEAFLLYDLINDIFPTNDLIQYKSTLSKEDREFLRNQIEKRDDGVIIISNFAMFKLGIDIPSLQTVIFASSLKSEISIPQVVGRILRLKEKTISRIYDIADMNVPFLPRHSKQRLEIYKENFGVFPVHFSDFYE